MLANAQQVASAPWSWTGVTWPSSTRLKYEGSDMRAALASAAAPTRTSTGLGTRPRPSVTSGSCSASTNAGLSGPGSGFAVVPAAPAAGSTVSPTSATSAIRRSAGTLRRVVM